MVKMLSDVAAQTMNRKSVSDFMREEEEFNERRRQRELAKQLQPMQLEKQKLELEKARRSMNTPDALFAGNSEFAQTANVVAKNIAAQDPNLSRLQIEKMTIDALRQGDSKLKKYVDPDTGIESYVPMPQDPLFGVNVFNPDPTQAPTMGSGDPVMDAQAARAAQAAKIDGYNPYSLDTSGVAPQPIQTPPVGQQLNDITERFPVSQNPYAETPVNLRAGGKKFQEKIGEYAAKESDPEFLLKQRETAEKKAKRQKIKQNEADSVAGGALRALEEMTDTRKDDMGILPEAGPVSYLYSWLGGTGANKVQNAIKSMTANIGFNKLQEIKEASPTGGAVGQLTEAERETLEKTIASLDQYQDPEELRENIKYVYNRFMDMVHGSPEDMLAYAKENNIPMEDIKDNLFRFEVGFESIDPRTLSRPGEATDVENLINQYAD